MSYPKSKLKKNVLTEAKDLPVSSVARHSCREPSRSKTIFSFSSAHLAPLTVVEVDWVFPLFLRCVLRRRGARLLLLLLPVPLPANKETGLEQPSDVFGFRPAVTRRRRCCRRARKVLPGFLGVPSPLTKSLASVVPAARIPYLTGQS